jgi:hypothetical protein
MVVAVELSAEQLREGKQRAEGSRAAHPERGERSRAAHPAEAE